MLGVKCRVPNGEVAAAARAEGLLLVPAGDNVVRLLPPLIIGEADVDEAIAAPRRGARRADAPRRRRVSAALGMGAPRHFLDLVGPPRRDAARHHRRQPPAEGGRPRRDRGDRPLDGRVLAMIFDKPSTRTRVSFDVAMRQLGGETVMLSGTEMQLGRGETLADTARVLSRYVDAIMIRILDHDALLELAEHATVPVINGLTQRSHPCQIMADLLTFEEHRGPIAGKKLAWSGDVNNVLASLVHAAGALRLPARRRRAAGASAARGAQRLDRREHGRGALPDRPGGGGRRRRLRHHRHLGLDGRGGGGAPAQSPEALPGERAGFWKKPSPTPYSCTASPPIAARR